MWYGAESGVQSNPHRNAGIRSGMRRVREKKLRLRERGGLTSQMIAGDTKANAQHDQVTVFRRSAIPRFNQFQPAIDLLQHGDFSRSGLDHRTNP